MRAKGNTVGSRLAHIFGEKDKPTVDRWAGGQGGEVSLVPGKPRDWQNPQAEDSERSHQRQAELPEPE